MSTEATCRSCGGTALEVFLSLGKMPLPDAFLTEEARSEPEPRYPLDVAVCPECALVQILEEVPPEKLFVENYLYFSSFSDALLRHARDHAMGLVESRRLGAGSLVVELASNDGYLLKNFASAGVPVLGIDPAPEPARAAEAAGVPTLREFFGTDLARRLVAEGKRADVIVANNVMAHVPDLNGFVAGMAVLLADDGLITVENPYVRDLVDHGEFDTIYHEHFCYFSCTSVDTLVRRHGLFLNHVEYFPDLHGGTLRWHIAKREEPTDAVRGYLAEERRRGVGRPAFYRDFAARVEGIRDELVALLRGLKDGGARLAGYGAAAKATILLNYTGIGSDLLDFIVDRNVHKHGLYMPGVHVPITGPEALAERRPDYTVILAWNFRREIVHQQAAYAEQGGRWIVPIPSVEVV
ncbi:MAG TPA: class I SAM-dependent methyltransferase [Acidimicrobiales bacterium]|nr:class I SAM-dependent methyltransferase [Acidimicrobiales bacterium]